MANYTILLIDYEPRSIERFRDPLVAAGYKVEIATDGVSGIETFHRINPDMVLVEAMIPKKHGFEVCQELKRSAHGRRTPVLITTGVYKGRKYRTQALHIYGCDEYIEKPIAAEQLLEIVGKFFAPGSAAAVSRAAEPAPAPVERTVERAPEPSAAPAARAPAPVETPAPKTERGKPAPIPKSSVAGDTEDEIMARLDAILPSGMFGEQQAEPAPVAMVATIEMPDEIDACLPDEIPDVDPAESPVELGAVAETGEDPFAQMRAELDAELGSFSAALALELEPLGDPHPVPESMPSDQAPSPSVLEALPEPETEIAIAPVPVSAPAVKTEMPGQVVNFDTKRSRKNKKSTKAAKESKPQAISIQPTPTHTPAPPLPAPPAPLAPPRATVPEMKLPKGTLVESVLEPPTARRGVSVWIWAVLGLAAMAGAYVFISRGGTGRNDAVPVPAAPTEIASDAPVPAPADAVANAQPESSESSAAASAVTTPPVSSAPAPTAATPVPDAKKPVASEAKPALAKKTPDTGAGVPLAATPPVAKSSSKAIAQWKPIQPAAPAPIDSDASVAGVEALPESAIPTQAAKIAAGTLVPLDEADVTPVSVQHKAPIYSLQARQMRLAGTVAMNVLVNEFGTVEQVVLVSGVPGADLNESAIRAAQEWTYRPATKQGVPVKVWKPEQIVFKP